MKATIKKFLLWSFLPGVIFYLLVGDGSEAILLMIILGFFEFKYKKLVSHY